MTGKPSAPTLERLAVKWRDGLNRQSEFIGVDGAASFEQFMTEVRNQLEANGVDLDDPKVALALLVVNDMGGAALRHEVRNADTNAAPMAYMGVVTAAAVAAAARHAGGS